MSENWYQHTVNGQEIQEADVNLLGKVGGLADDKALMVLFRMLPFDGSTVTKFVLPCGNSATNSPTVEVTGSGNGSVLVHPFRAFIGSRTALTSGAERANITDVRSGIFTGAGSLVATQAFAANSSGTARIDLVYAVMSVDQNAASLVRKVKDPTSSVITSPAVYTQVAQTIAIGVVAGTPSASPALPSIPADSASNYYIPLAYVRIPNGFGGTTTIARSWIIDASPIKTVHGATGAVATRVANSLYKPGGSAFTTARIASWANTGAFPNYYIPPSITGETTLWLALDLGSASSASWSVQNLALIDDSIDWRNRLFTWTAVISADTGTARAFPWENPADIGDTSGILMQSDTLSTAQNVLSGVGQSFTTDETQTAYVLTLDHTNAAQIAAGAIVNLEVSTALGSTGGIHVKVTNTPRARIIVRLVASAQFTHLAAAY